MTTSKSNLSAIMQSKFVSCETPSTDLSVRLRQFIEDEARSGSMEPALITPEYLYRMWGGKVPLEDIEAALKQL